MAETSRITSVLTNNQTKTMDWTHLIPSGSELCFSVMFLLLGIDLVTANGVLLWLIRRKKVAAKSFNNKMAASQATSDLLLGLFITPMEVIHQVLPDANVNEYVCLVHQVSILFFPFVSTFHLIFVALERFLKVVHPLQASKVGVKSKVKFIIGFCWILPSVFAVFPFLGWNRLGEEELRYGNTEPFGSHYKYVSQTPCSRLEHLHCSYISLLITIILSMYLGMVAMYFQVVVVARRKVEQTAMASDRDCDMREEVKILYILLWSAGYFVVSWCPLVSVVSVECMYAPTPDIVWVLTLVFAYCNNVISPLVYGYGNRNIREFVSNKIRGNRSRVTPIPQRQSGEQTVLTEKTKVHVTTCVVIYE